MIEEYKEKSQRVKNNLFFERTKDGERVYDIYSRLAKERGIFIKGEIDVDVGSEISAHLLLLDQQSDKPITMYINSYGGEVNAGLFAILDTMNYIKSPVYTICIGIAYSAAAVLLSAGEPGHRVCFPNSDIMIHDVQVHGHGYSSMTKLKKKTELNDKLNERLISILADNTKKDREQIKDLMKEETWMGAEDAIKFGLIDRIVKKKGVKSDDIVESSSAVKKTSKKAVKKS
jgi:ATP-dependent Clp protease protease subunit